MKLIFTRPWCVQNARQILLIVMNATSQTRQPIVTAPCARLVADSEPGRRLLSGGLPRRQACSRAIAAVMLPE
ncbi:MAG TPA: hypothetical protein VF612_07335 [Jatrophihabitans sp.]|jgi:hypothetical protein|uniref:hypothetical protein n=1 Tax=Jatrophihabitans sp. TaxID=1932789 RepID=UPI002EE29E88